MEWISVEDRLPEPAQSVLVYSERECRVSKGYGVDYVLSGFSTSFMNIGYVTHWMYLPEPPKETEANPLIEMHLSVDPGMADSIEETE